MADTVASYVIADTQTAYAIKLVCVSDGTGETNVVKVDKSTLTMLNGSNAAVEPAALDVQCLRWNVQGFTSVRLSWDHGTDDLFATMSGSGFDDTVSGGPVSEGLGTRGLRDPKTADGTGDILLTSAGAASGATYDITIWFRKRLAAAN